MPLLATPPEGEKYVFVAIALFARRQSRVQRVMGMNLNDLRVSCFIFDVFIV
jgi:hypothetical protein